MRCGGKMQITKSIEMTELQYKDGVLANWELPKI